MGDLGLEIDKAINAVLDEDGTKKKKKGRRRGPKKDSSKRSELSHKSGGTTGGEHLSKPKEVVAESGLDFYFRKPAEALLKGMSSPGPTDDLEEWEDRDGFLFAEEIDSDSDTDSEYSADGAPTRPRIAREGSQNRNGLDLRYLSITGNVPPTQLSIATVVPEEELMLLQAGENYGVVISTDETSGKKKKKKKKRRNQKGVFGVSIVKYEFKGMSSEGREEEDGEDSQIGDGVSDPLYLADDIRREEGAHVQRNDGARFWPPPAVVDVPEPPLDKPPRENSARRSVGSQDGGSASVVRRPSFRLSRTPSPPPPPSGVASAGAVPIAPPESVPMLRKQTSMIRGTTNVISKGITKLTTNFRSTNRNSTNMGLHGLEERFVVAADVPWVIPPPPQPRPPPPDGTDAEQIMLDFELLRMFIEDLRATAMKLEERQTDKSDRISKLQTEIERVDDEIALLLQPNAPGQSTEAVTSQLESVTSGKIFRVEKYEP